MQKRLLVIGSFLLVTITLSVYGRAPISILLRNHLSVNLSHSFLRNGSSIVELPPNSGDRTCQVDGALYQELLSALPKMLREVHPQGLISYLVACGNDEDRTSIVAILEDLIAHGYILLPMERYYLGEMLLVLNRGDELVKHWKNSSEMANLLASRGQAALHVNGDSQQALMYFSLSEALLSTPTVDRVMMYMGQCQIYLGQQKLTEAEDACELLKSFAYTENQRVIAHNLLGRIFYDSGDLRKAQDEFETATIEQPNNAENYFWLGLALESRGFKEEATDKYKKVLELDSTHVSARNALDRLLK